MAPKSTPDSNQADLSRRSFIERVVGTGVAAPALATLAGSWLAGDTAFAQPQEQSNQIPVGSASSGSGSVGVPSITYAIADTTLRHDSQNTNEGANPRIRVGARPVRRGVIAFDAYTVAAMRSVVDGQTRLYLALQIATNANNWSQSGDQFVDAHPLPVDFEIVEGDGMYTGLPETQTSRGNGAGATWRVPVDAEIADTKVTVPAKDVKKGKKPKPKPQPWNGASDVMGPATAEGVLHVNGLDGVLYWDVTEDVLAGASAWVVKVRDEDEPVNTPCGRKQGFDPFDGAVDYYSREGAAENYDVLPPSLHLLDFNPNGGSSSSGSASHYNPYDPCGSASGSGSSIKF